MSAHHHQCGGGFRSLLLEDFLGGLDLQDLTLDLPLRMPLLGAVHVLYNLSLSHLLLIGLLLSPYIIFARMSLVVLLFWLMIKLADLLAQCSLGIIPEMHMVLSFVIVPILKLY